MEKIGSLESHDTVPLITAVVEISAVGRKAYQNMLTLKGVIG
jgi:hypothetical protein